MYSRTKMLLGALTAATMLASAIGNASANRLSIAPSERFRITWTPITLETAPEAEPLPIACNVTLEGSFHYRTIFKVLRSLIGYVTKAATQHPCSGWGEAWYHNGVEEAGLGHITDTLPWRISYEGFDGILPQIAGVRVLFSLTLTLRLVVGTLCQYSGNVEGVASLGGSGEALEFVPDRNVPLFKTSGSSFICRSLLYPSVESGRGRVRSRITASDGSTLITVKLI
jgi:hypothetical protein